MTTEVKMPGTPPDWVNRAMGLMLRTPVLQRLVGKMFALITVTGTKTGRRYTTPVQYFAYDGEFVVLSQQMRRWWKNVRTRPEIEIRIDGESVHGRGRVASGDEARSVLAGCLREQPRVAKFYGLEPGESGVFGEADLESLLERVAVIVVTPHPMDVELEAADFVMQGF